MVVVHYKTHGLWPLVEAFVPIDDSGARDVDFIFGLSMRYPPVQRKGRTSQNCGVIFFSFHSLLSSIHSEETLTCSLT